LSVITEFIVLKKLPFKESSLIVSGLSPEYGRLDFLIKGAVRYTKRKFPEVDIFRILEVKYSLSKTGMQSLYKCDMLRDFDSLASNTEIYMAACSAAGFILKNTRQDMPVEELYAAMKFFLENAVNSASGFRTDFPVKLVYLHENGLFPNHLSAENNEADEAKRKNLIDRLVKYFRGEAPEPEISVRYLHRLAEWTDALCHYHGLN
jgi:DNA repair protein RecO